MELGNYMVDFIHHIPTITIPLTEWSENARWLLTDLQQAAFEALHRAADKQKVLIPIDYNKPNMIWLFTDTLPTGMRAGIGQWPTRDAARPAALHSLKLTVSRSNYSTHQHDTVAII